MLLPSPLDNSLPIDALFPPSAKQALWVLCHCRALAGNPTWSALISERGGRGSRGEAGNLFPEGGGGSKPFPSEADGRCPPARAAIKPSTCSAPICALLSRPGQCLIEDAFHLRPPCLSMLVDTGDARERQCLIEDAVPEELLPRYAELIKPRAPIAEAVGTTPTPAAAGFGAEKQFPPPQHTASSSQQGGLLAAGGPAPVSAAESAFAVAETQQAATLPAAAGLTPAAVTTVPSPSGFGAGVAYDAHTHSLVGGDAAAVASSRDDVSVPAPEPSGLRQADHRDPRLGASQQQQQQHCGPSQQAPPEAVEVVEWALPLPWSKRPRSLTPEPAGALISLSPGGDVDLPPVAGQQPAQLTSNSGGSDPRRERQQQQQQQRLDSRGSEAHASLLQQESQLQEQPPPSPDQGQRSGGVGYQQWPRPSDNQMGPLLLQQQQPPPPPRQKFQQHALFQQPPPPPPPLQSQQQQQLHSSFQPPPPPPPPRVHQTSSQPPPPPPQAHLQQRASAQQPPPPPPRGQQVAPAAAFHLPQGSHLHGTQQPQQQRLYQQQSSECNC